MNMKCSRSFHTSFALAIILMGGAFAGFAQPFHFQSAPADLARWMYPFNTSPANRASASTFAGFGSIPIFDTRDGQYLLGWNTSNNIPAGMGARNYLLRRARVTLTLSLDMAYAYSGTLQDYRTYFPTNDPRYLPTTNTDSPVELFGASFRGGYTALTFPQDGPFSSSGSAYYTNRNAYAACFDANGALVDVSNNVGDNGTNEISTAFEVAPFAVGQATNLAEGQLTPAGSQLTFDLNLADPLIYGYVQQALNNGGIRLVASSLVAASYGGSPNYPDFYTPFSPIAETNQYPLLDIEGTVVRTNLDSDGDGLPDDWEQFYFGRLGIGATNSFAGAGVSNLAKYIAGTDPTNPTDEFRLFSVQRQSNVAELHFTFAPSRQYSVQWSDDLRHWQTVTNPAFSYSSAWLSKTRANLVYPSPVFAVWRDTNTPSDKRFYRIAVQ